MRLCTNKQSKKEEAKTDYVHSITEDWWIYLSEGAQLIKNMMQLSWLFDYITAFQTHPKVKALSVQKWVLQRNGPFPILMCLKRNGKMVLRLELKGENHQANAVIWVKDHVALTNKEFRKDEKQ